jgi:type VI secretion system secreted protein Hcp
LNAGTPRRRLGRRITIIVAPLVVALGAGTAIAATSGSSDPIQACVSVIPKGAVRIVSSPSDCINHLETPLTWNQQGAAGAAGAKGDKGDTGPQGPAGAAGGDGGTVVGGKVLQGATADMFLDLDGIAGESTDAQHLNDIDVKSFSFGVKNDTSAGSGGGGGAGKPTFSSVTFSKVYDKSSPQLFQLTATGQHVKSAVFSFRRSGPNGDGFLTYKLTDVTVVDYEQGGDKEPPLLERVSLNFAKVEISYTPIAGGAPVTAGWDLKANSPAV